MSWILSTLLTSAIHFQPPVVAMTPTVMTAPPTRLTDERDRIAARTAWKYFEHNWDQNTGLVNSVDQLPWTTLWDQGSAMLGIHAAHQLGLITETRLNQRLETLFHTLEVLPIPSSGLPNKAYDTQTTEMQRLDMRRDTKWGSGWSALDMARFLLGLHVLKTNYPQHRDRIDRIVSRWKLSKLESDGWLYGGNPDSVGRMRRLQEGRYGYEQYAAHSLRLWSIEAKNALNSPPTKTVEVDGISFTIDQRDFTNSGATNYLTNEPYLLWALELSLPENIQPQFEKLLQVQQQRYNRTGIVTAVNEDSLDRAPYFLYYNIFANGESWQPISTKGKTFPHLRFLSTKAAFAWEALRPNHPYTTLLRQTVQNFSCDRGYFSGRYEVQRQGMNTTITVNTNAVILESLLYKARNRPLGQTL